MPLFDKNLKFLRKQKKLSQESLAKEVGTSRGNIGQYELGNNYPSIEMLVVLSKFFKVPVVDLVETNLAENNINHNLSSTPNTVHLNENPVHLTRSTRKNNILVPLRAQAGYLVGFTQEIIDQELHYVDVPGVEGEARTFEVAGDSMEPLLSDGDYVVTRRVEDARSIREGTVYVIISSLSGVSVKYLYRMQSGVMLIPANRMMYKPTFVEHSDILELWEVFMRITRSFTNPVAFSELLTETKRIDRMEEYLKQNFNDFGRKSPKDIREEE